MNIIPITVMPDVPVEAFFYCTLDAAVKHFASDHGHTPATVYVWQGAACPIYYIELSEGDHLGKLPLSEDLLTV